MVDTSTQHKNASKEGNPWKLLRVYLRFGGSVAGVDLKATLPVKHPRSLRAANPGPPKRHTHRRASAAGLDPAVKELRQRLKAHGSLLREWEAAGQRVSDELLWRWLRARGSVEETESSLLRHAQWRTELGPIEEADLRSELDAEKVFLQGCDLQGRPVVVVLAARHVIRRRNLDETRKLITFTLETAIAAADPVKNPLGQILCIFDLSGLGLGNLDTKALQAVFEVLQQHFPESLSELWFLNAPFIFWGLWRVVSPFIQPSTRDKIQFLSGAHRSQMLTDTLSQQVLPQCYGGLADLVSVEKAAKWLARQASASEAVSTADDAASMQDHPGRLSVARRVAVKALAGGWGFVRDHNPVWAGKVVGGGIARVASAVPGWPGRHSRMNRHASMLAERVHSAWLRRPPLPRPSYRYQQQAVDSTRLALLDVVAFYLIAVSLVGLAVLLYQQWFLSSYIPTAVGWLRR